MMLLSDALIYSAVIITVVTGDVKPKVTQFPSYQPVSQSAQVKIGDHHIQASSHSSGGVGASSIAGVTSRNGRVSSFSGVYHPGLGSPIMIASGDMKEFLPSTKTTNGRSSSMTFTKEFEDKFSTGTVKISPGSVSVSSVAKSGPAQFDSYKESPPMFPMNPFNYDPFWQPRFSMFAPTYDPFANAMYRNPIPSIPSRSTNMRPAWLYPSLNPFFNYWQ